MKLPRALLCLALACALPATADAARPRTDAAYAGALAAVTRDPPRDAQHPARNRQLVIESHGAGMNALFFQAAGAGPHPTMLLLHGLPGNERNLDLAQAVRRAGWNVLTFTYRGAWGSGGDFSIANAVEDTHAALAFLRSPEAIRDYGVDQGRLVVAGHSMGGYMAAQEAAADSGDPRMPALRTHPRLAGMVLLDAWNIAGDATQVRAAGAAGRARLVAGLDDFGHSLHGASPESVADEIVARGPDWSIPALAPRLRWTPTLTISALHGGAEANRATTAALRSAGATVTAREIDSDHPFADHRIALAAEVVRWLRALP
jgi:pimeloyl-ACP methyl ester carboxylesterase